MKKIMLLILLVTSGMLLARDFNFYACKSERFRNDQGLLPHDSLLYVDLLKEDDGSFELVKLMGHMKLADDDATSAYYNIFNSEKFPADISYKPLKYKESVRFKEINSIASSSSSEEGMWGDFVIEKTMAENVKAHYIFKAGDHLGGTVDFSCKNY